jgi:anti-sigma factor RsiW
MIHPSAAELHDFADDEATAAERARIQAHLRTCPSCRNAVEGIVGLREEAQRMAADPSQGMAEGVPDQWPEIEARIIRVRANAGSSPSTLLHQRASTDQGAVVREDPQRVSLADRPGRGSWGMWPAAAAIALIGISTAVTVLLDRTPAGQEGGVETLRAPASERAVGIREAAVADAYAPVMTELEAILAEGRGRLLPETVAVLEENLRVLDAAIEEVERALAQDPADVGMLRSLDGIYRSRVGMLRRAVELTGRT